MKLKEKTESEQIKRAQHKKILTTQNQNVNKNWSISLKSESTLKSQPKQNIVPLGVILAFSEVNSEESGHNISSLRKPLENKFKKFLEKNYSADKKNRGTEFLGSTSKESGFKGEASIANWFDALKSEPTLIIETAIDGDFFDFRVGYWGIQGQTRYCYSTILHNHHISTLTKNISSDDSENSLLEFFVTCHCLLASWIIDSHYLVNYGVTPLLPKLLPELMKGIFPEEEREKVVKTIVAGYHKVYQTLAKEQPTLIPKLYLQLAESVTDLTDLSLARHQVDLSIKTWLHQRKFSNIRGGNPLELMGYYLSEKDEKYVQKLSDIWTILNEPKKVAITQDHLRKIKQLKQVLNKYDRPFESWDSMIWNSL